MCLRQAEAPTGIVEHARLFGVAPRFSADEDALELRRSDLDAQLRSANPQLLATFDQHATATLAALDSRTSLVARVNQELVTKLKGEVLPITKVASALAMSARNLQRGLAAEGTTFSSAAR